VWHGWDGGTDVNPRDVDWEPDQTPEVDDVTGFSIGPGSIGMSFTNAPRSIDTRQSNDFEDIRFTYDWNRLESLADCPCTSWAKLSQDAIPGDTILRNRYRLNLVGNKILWPERAKVGPLELEYVFKSS
jgi:hypothetical protein